MQYGSIGWSVGATLGYAQAVPKKRVIACIGDGSFQVIPRIQSLYIGVFIWLEPWLNCYQVCPHWKTLISAGYSSGCFDNAKMRPKDYHLPDKQWWLHH